jgi:hypothetical protein
LRLRDRHVVARASPACPTRCTLGAKRAHPRLRVRLGAAGATAAEDAASRFGERVLATLLGVGIAYLYGLALPALTARPK